MGKPEKEIQGYSDDPRQWKHSEEMKNKIHLLRQVKISVHGLKLTIHTNHNVSNNTILN